MAVTSMSQSSIRDYTKSNRVSNIVSPYPVSYVIIAGGGGGGNVPSGVGKGGGGGAGGYRCSVTGEDSGGGADAENKLLLRGR